MVPAIAVAATWFPAPIPGYWLIEFLPPLVGSVGLTDPTRWACRAGLAWQQPDFAEVTGAGQVKLAKVGWGGGENRVLYLGPPPELRTAAAAVLQAFEHDIPF